MRHVPLGLVVAACVGGAAMQMLLVWGLLVLDAGLLPAFWVTIAGLILPLILIVRVVYRAGLDAGQSLNRHGEGDQ